MMSAQIAALSTSQVQHLTLGTPIILDLNGDGVKTLSISSGVKFDLFATGQAVNTGWVSGGDGLLVLDRNHDGVINDGSELFGSSTTLASGAKAPDGYAALRELDTNRDGTISSADAVYADLRVWVDGNSDGVSQTSELKTLASLGISQIDLQATAGLATDNGNLVGLTSTYETTDGASHAAADVWFVADASGTGPVTVATPVAAAAAGDNPVVALASATPVAEIAAVPEAAGAAANAPAAVAAVDVDSMLQGPPVPPTVQDTKTDLRSRVSSLAQAMGAFGSTSDVQDAVFGTPLDTSGGLAAGPTPAALTVGSMVDVMKQFDANGRPVGAPATVVAALGKSLSLPGLPDPSSNGFLATGGK
jgi:hypothetical protein